MNGGPESQTSESALSANPPFGIVLKRCKTCQTKAPLAEFYKNSTYTDGHFGECKKCCRKRQKAYRDDHPELLKERAKKYRETHKEQINKAVYRWQRLNRERHLRNRRSWVYKNRDKVNSDARKYRDENRDKIHATQRRWAKAHPDKINEKKRRRIIRKASTVEVFANLEIFERDKWICQLCRKKVNKKLKHPNPLSSSLDHIVPLSKGGSHTKNNVQLAHLKCNEKAGCGGIKQLFLFG